MDECIFCKIATGEISTNKLYEDDQMIAFSDMSPQAPIHFLVIPKKHIGSLDDLEEVDQALIGAILLKIPKIAEKQGIQNGYRVVTNIGADGGQTVEHLHFHVLGGRTLEWPPG